MSDDKLQFMTLALRRTMPSDHHELSPVVAPAITSYGTEDRTAIELQLAMSELPDETRPTTVARFLLPDGVRLEQIEVELGRPELPGRLGRRHPVTITVVPEPRAEGGPAGHWVFVPVLQHACFVSRTEDLAKRLTAELAVLPSALALDVDGWKRLITWAPTSLEPNAVELATTPLGEAQGRKALAEAERKRQAIATLDGAGRRVVAPSPPPPVVGRDELLAEITRLLDGRVRRSVLIVGDEAAGKSALISPEVERGGLRPAREEDRRYRDAVLAAFRPELINRLDQIVVFHPLTPDEIATVAQIAISRLAERRGFTQGGVMLDVSPRALEVIAEGGFSAELGARALRRHLDASVLAPAARLLARAGAEGHGGTLTVRAPDEAITRPAGSRLSETTGAVNLALWRRSSTPGAGWSAPRSLSADCAVTPIASSRTTQRPPCETSSPSSRRPSPPPRARSRTSTASRRPDYRVTSSPGCPASTRG